MLALPRAYELDDLTYGVLWAVSTLDEALLADDGALAESSDAVKAYESPCWPAIKALVACPT